MRSRPLSLSLHSKSSLSGSVVPALRRVLLAGWLLNAGCPGGDSVKELLTSTQDATAAECPKGGKAVLSGLDENGNGQLDTSEVAERTVLCTETNPAEPPPRKPDPEDPDPEETAPVQRVRVDVEPAGENCAHGGSAVSMGADLDGDGVLSDDEVEDTEFTCDDALVSRIHTTPDGEGCVGQGVSFELGRDRDQSGTLEDGEVEWSELDCDDVVAHDITIQSAEELEAIQNIRVIEGNLSIHDTSLARVELPRLEQLGGNLYVSSNGFLDAMLTPALESVGASVDIQGNDVLTEIDLGGLERVAQDFLVHSHPKLSLLKHAALNYIGGDLTIRQNAGITAIDISLLRGMGNVVVAENPAVETLSIYVSDFLHAANQRLGNVWIWNNDALSKADVTAKELGEVSILGGASLKELRLRADTAQTLNVDSPALASLFWGGGYPSHPVVRSFVSIDAPITYLPAFQAGGNVRIRGSELETLTIDRVGYDLRVEENPRLKNLYVHEPLGSIVISDNDALTTARVGRGFDRVVLRGSLTVDNNDALQNLAGFQNVTTINGSLYIHDNLSLVRTHLFALTSVEDVSIYASPALKWLDFGDITSMRGVNVNGTGIEKLDHLDHLRSVGSLTVEQNSALQSISLPALVYAPTLHTLENPLLTTLDLPALEQYESSTTTIRNNALLPVCAVDQLFSRIKGSKEQAGNLESASCPPAP